MCGSDITGISLRAELVQEIVLICADAFYFLPCLGLILLQPYKHAGIEAADT